MIFLLRFFQHIKYLLPTLKLQQSAIKLSLKLFSAHSLAFIREPSANQGFSEISQSH
jgi:hypothetical protein